MSPPGQVPTLPFEVEDGGPVLNVAGSALTRRQAFSLYMKVGDWLSRQPRPEVAIEVPAPREPPTG